MESLIRLINCLKPKEVQIVKDYCKTGCSKNSHDKKRLLLFKLILEGKIHNDKEAHQILYQHNSPSALCKLKKRLQHDIQNIILLSHFTHVDEEVVKEELGCHKSFLLGKVLINRGLSKEGIHLLERTSTMAEKWELPHIKLACDDTLRTMQINTEHNLHQIYGKEISRSLENFNNLLKAKSTYFSALQTTSFAPHALLSGAELDRLEEKLNVNQSAKATYWYAMALIRYYIQEKDFNHARSCASKLSDKVSENQHIISLAEQADFHVQCARISIFSGKPQEAIKPAQQAARLFQGSRQDVLTAMELLFFAYFQNSNWNQAEALLHTVYEENEMPSEEVAGIWSLLKCCLLFMQEKFRESNSWLLTHENLLNEKSYTILWAKLLELLNILEMQDYDWFEYKLESFRKRLRRCSMQSMERIRMLCQLFNSLRKFDYNYQIALQHEQTNLTILQSNDQALGWNPLSYELINTGQWFFSKT